MPEREISNPFPETVQVTPPVEERHWNGPSPVELPYSRAGVLFAALPSQLIPQSLTEPSGTRVADSGGVRVSQKAAFAVELLA
jgi:hypothetical protein